METEDSVDSLDSLDSIKGTLVLGFQASQASPRGV